MINLGHESFQGLVSDVLFSPENVASVQELLRAKRDAYGKTFDYNSEGFTVHHEGGVLNITIRDIKSKVPTTLKDLVPDFLRKDGDLVLNLRYRVEFDQTIVLDLESHISLTGTEDDLTRHRVSISIFKKDGSQLEFKLKFGENNDPSTIIEAKLINCDVQSELKVFYSRDGLKNRELFTFKFSGSYLMEYSEVLVRLTVPDVRDLLPDALNTTALQMITNKYTKRTIFELEYKIPQVYSKYLYPFSPYTYLPPYEFQIRRIQETVQTPWYGFINPEFYSTNDFITKSEQFKVSCEKKGDIWTTEISANIENTNPVTNSTHSFTLGGLTVDLHKSIKSISAHLFNTDDISLGANMNFTISHDTVGKLYQATLSDSNSEGGYVLFNLAEDLKTGNLSSHINNKDIEDLSGTLSTKEDKESGQITYYIGYVYTGSTVEQFIQLKFMPMEKDVTRLEITSSELQFVANRSIEITENSIFSRDFDMKLLWEEGDIWENELTLITSNDKVNKMYYYLNWEIGRNLGVTARFFDNKSTDASRIAVITQALNLDISGRKVSAMLGVQWFQFNSDIMNYLPSSSTMNQQMILEQPF